MHRISVHLSRVSLFLETASFYSIVFREYRRNESHVYYYVYGTGSDMYGLGMCFGIAVAASEVVA